MNETALYWLGVDVARQTFDVALAGPGEHANPRSLKGLAVATFARSPEGVSALLDWVRQQLAPSPGPLPVRAVMEATGMYSIQLTAWLCKQCPELRPAIVNPERTAAFRDSLGLRNKTDRIDARALAFFGQERHPDPYEPLSREQAELRTLSRCRASLIAQRVAHQNQVAQEPESALVVKTLKQLIARLTKDLEKLEAAMREVIGAHDSLRGDYALLTSIPSVGFVTAAVILAELGDLRRFGSARQIGAHAGVTAFQRESGTQAQPGHMSKKGNARVRQALYMAALSAPIFNPTLKKVYQRLLVQGKKPMVAIGAIMRKLLVLMRAIIVSGKPFDPCGKLHQKDPNPCLKTA